MHKTTAGFILLIVLIIIVISVFALGTALWSVGIEKQININQVSEIHLLNAANVCLDEVSQKIKVGAEFSCIFSDYDPSYILNLSEEWWRVNTCHITSLVANFMLDYWLEPLAIDDCAVIDSAVGVQFIRITCRAVHEDPLHPSIVVQAVVAKKHQGSSCAGNIHELESVWQGYRRLKT